MLSCKAAILLVHWWSHIHPPKQVRQGGIKWIGEGPGNRVGREVEGGAVRWQQDGRSVGDGVSWFCSLFLHSPCLLSLFRLVLAKSLVQLQGDHCRVKAYVEIKRFKSPVPSGASWSPSTIGYRTPILAELYQRVGRWRKGLGWKCTISFEREFDEDFSEDFSPSESFSLSGAPREVMCDCDI